MAWGLTAALVFGATARGDASPPAYDADLAARAGSAPRRAAQRAPRLMWAIPDPTGGARTPRSSPRAAARHALEAHARRLGLPAAAVATAEVAEVHDTGRGGIIVSFRQRVAGLPVLGREVDVLLRRDLDPVAVSGALHPAATVATGSGLARFDLAAEDALAAAVSDLYGARAAFRRTGAAGAGYGDYRLAPSARDSGVSLAAPARARRVLYPLGDRLIPAYAVHVIASLGPRTDADAYAYVFAGDDGTLLRRRNLAAHAAFSYRVWADADGDHEPADGPHADLTPHPSGEPSELELEFAAPNLVETDGLNTNPSGGADPWLSGGATETRGNNVDAYADHHAPDGFTMGEDERAATTSDGTFDYTYDTAAGPLAADSQIMAAVTQLFYVNNWLHDWYYDSGFDEEAGNAQADNFGRGGAGSDPLLAEAQDAARTDDPPKNNANMLTPPDGTSPRMQMYVWDGPTVALVDALGMEISTVGTASFGPENFDLEADVVRAEDGSTDSMTDTPGSTTDACQPLTSDAPGAIVLADRGACTFVTKAQSATDAGAAALLVANSDPEGVTNMAGSDGGMDPDLPSLMVTRAVGEDLADSLPATARLFRDSSAPDRDGTIDNAIVAHEWGHYLHHRLVQGCTLVSQCNAMSEGWGDFVALHLVLDADDDPSGAYALAQYATASLGQNVYFGIRRVPYSTDFGTNALTFRHIANGEPLPEGPPMRSRRAESNAEIHNAGEVWASALFEAYAALLAAHPFDDARRRMSDYVVAGMKMAPPSPTFTEQRTALLAAVRAADADDFEIMAEAFATRGLGSGAASPARSSTDFQGVVESFETRGELAFAGAELADRANSCDGDGVLDVTETGELTVTVENAGFAELTGTEVAVETDAPGIALPGGGTAAIETLPPLSAEAVTVPVTADASVDDLAEVEFSVTLANSGSATAEVTGTATATLNYDDVQNVTTTDTVESPSTTWTAEDTRSATAVWQRAEQSGNTVWHGDDPPSVGDSRLVSPELEVSGDGDLVVEFRHRHAFETSGDVSWDGGVVEIRRAGGEWTDVRDLASPGYGGIIGGEGAGNPLYGRSGYVGRNSSYPEMDTVTLDFGGALAGETVQLRFRIGADQATAADGWDIDDISVSGIENEPFGRVEPEGGDCASVGDPNAGAGGCGCASSRGSSLASALLAGLVLFSLFRRRRDSR